jgi:uncharacterized protein (DUF2062 family)
VKFRHSGAFRKRHHHPLSWRRRFRILLLELLGREEPIERVAAAIGLGVAIGFSPFLGFHLVLALGLATLLGLNRLDAALGTLAGNPWTFSPVFALGYRLGRALLHHDPHRVPPMNWNALLHSGFAWIFHPLETVRLVFGPRAFIPRLHAFLLGTTVLSILIGAATYFLALGALKLYHRRHPRVAARAARRRTTDSGETKRVEEGDELDAHRPRPTVAGGEGNSKNLVN